MAIRSQFSSELQTLVHLAQHSKHIVITLGKDENNNLINDPNFFDVVFNRLFRTLDSKSLNIIFKNLSRQNVELTQKLIETVLKELFQHADKEIVNDGIEKLTNIFKQMDKEEFMVYGHTLMIVNSKYYDPDSLLLATSDSPEDFAKLIDHVDSTEKLLSLIINMGIYESKNNDEKRNSMIKIIKQKALQIEPVDTENNFLIELFTSRNFDKFNEYISNLSNLYEKLDEVSKQSQAKKLEEFNNFFDSTKKFQAFIKIVYDEVRLRKFLHYNEDQERIKIILQRIEQIKLGKKKIFNLF